MNYQEDSSHNRDNNTYYHNLHKSLDSNSNC